MSSSTATEEGQYFAYVPELPGCQTCADTIDELMTNIREAIDLYLEVAPDRGEEFPSVRKFEELRARMSPAAREKSHRMAQRILDEMPLRKLRLERGLSQEDISRRLGVSQARVSKA